ncbi:hypothetical protein PAHAL_9G503200 [Panicum hallii]|uniref:Uncharacterized protein n=1 Tax=Panicum hallii TaxID=206008 RepID=A0A2T8I595_9POAL|nr:hypothetical protein PAHAL_9G503200 [Panicum hallii]
MDGVKWRYFRSPNWWSSAHGAARLTRAGPHGKGILGASEPFGAMWTWRWWPRTRPDPSPWPEQDRKQIRPRPVGSVLFFFK